MQKILVVEDEPTIADAIRFTLNQEAFDVTCVTTIGEARKLIGTGSFSMVIVDVGLPDGSGFEFCREIRSTSSVPIIFLTARGEEVDRIVGLEIGADDYVTKPFSPRELSARVRAVLRRSNVPPSLGSIDSSNSSGLTISKAQYDFSFDAKPLELSRYEFRLLESLHTNQGRVLSREQLMNLSWEDPEMSLERTVDTHIKSIRAKLKQAGCQDELIITHRGIGYSMKKAG